MQTISHLKLWKYAPRSKGLRFNIGGAPQSAPGLKIERHLNLQSQTWPQAESKIGALAEATFEVKIARHFSELFFMQHASVLTIAEQKTVYIPSDSPNHAACGSVFPPERFSQQIKILDQWICHTGTCELLDCTASICQAVPNFD